MTRPMKLSRAHMESLLCAAMRWQMLCHQPGTPRHELHTDLTIPRETLQQDARYLVRGLGALLERATGASFQIVEKAP